MAEDPGGSDGGGLREDLRLNAISEYTLKTFKVELQLRVFACKCVA